MASGSRVQKVSSVAEYRRMVRKTSAGVKLTASAPTNSAGVTFSWGPVGPVYEQKRDDCWTYAFATGHAYHNEIRNLKKPKLTPELLSEGVSKKYQTKGGGLSFLEHAKDFMVQGNYVKDMAVYKRGTGNMDIDELVERLLHTGAVVVSLEAFPSYGDSNAKEIYSPFDEEIRNLRYEANEDHVVVVTGIGAEVVNGELTEFWHYQNSEGSNWGSNGFGRLASGRSIISEVVEFQF